MSLLAYAVAESGSPAIDDAGLDGAPLLRIRVRGVALVVSRQASRPPEPTPQALWRYEEIVERLMARQPILPARFGSVLASEEDAREALAARHDELCQALAKVRGAVELGIRGTWTTQPEHPPASSGTEYMLGQLDIRRRAERAARLLDPLGALARSSKMKVLPRQSIPFSGAYLVDAGETDRFFAKAGELGSSLEDAELVCTGPWPPYSFAEAPALDRDVSGVAR